MVKSIKKLMAWRKKQHEKIIRKAESFLHGWKVGDKCPACHTTHRSYKSALKCVVERLEYPIKKI